MVSRKMLEFAERSSWIRRMFEEGARLKAAHGAGRVFDFSLGNPDLPPPPEFGRVLQAVAADEPPGIHGYMPNSGYLWVREAVARRIAREQQTAVGADDIIMTCGAAGGLNIVLKALLDPGDEVIVLAPFFVEYHFYIDNHGGVCRVVETREDFHLDLQAIEEAIGPRTKALIINSPNNPSGRIYPEPDLRQLGAVLARAESRHGCRVCLVADEPYRRLVYDGLEVPSIFNAWPRSIVVSSSSKDLSLPGERIGLVAVNPEFEQRGPLLAALNLANRILGFVNAPALMQRVVAQLQEVGVDIAIYARRRRLFCEILQREGYELNPPDGAFYLFPKSPLADEIEFVRLLAAERVLAVPGRGFGRPGYFRLAFCAEDRVIEGAAAGFAAAMAKAHNR